jgi:hypothetical protein
MRMRELGSSVSASLTMPGIVDPLASLLACVPIRVHEQSSAHRTTMQAALTPHFSERALADTLNVLPGGGSS